MTEATELRICSIPHCKRPVEDGSEYKICERCRTYRRAAMAKKRTRARQLAEQGVRICTICLMPTDKDKKYLLCTRCRGNAVKWHNTRMNKAKTLSEQGSRVCNRCLKPVEEGSSAKICAGCHIYINNHYSKKMEKAMTDGYCAKCRREQDGTFPNEPLCPECRKQRSQAEKDRRLKRLSSGLCTKCGQRDKGPGVTTCPPCQEIERIRHKANRAKLKAQKQ